MVARLCLSLCLALLVVIVPARQRSIAETDIPAWTAIQDSIVVVGYVRDVRNAQSFYRYGSAFCIKADGSSTQFLTGNHVVKADYKDEKLVVLLPGRSAVQATIVTSDTRLDLAIVSANVGVNLRPLKFSAALPRQTEKIATGGFPFVAGVRFGGLYGPAELINGQPADLQAEPHLGMVTALHPKSAPSVISFDLNGGGLDHGNSGGPVFDPKTGEVYGVIQSFVTGTPADNKNAGTQASTAVSNVALVNSAAVAFITGKKTAVVALGAPSVQQVGSRKGGAQLAKGTTRGVRRSMGIDAAAKTGFGSAENELGLKYQYGSGVTQSYAEAVRYFELAASAGNADARSNLGLMYLYGLGVAVNHKRAVELFAESAASYNVSGLYNLARSYEYGFGTNQSLSKAIALYTEAQKRGSVSAAYALGWIDYDRTDFAGALSAFTIAAQRGNAAAARQLGVMYEEGIGGTQPDSAKALAWYVQAAKRGDHQAQYHLGNQYEYGRFVARDPAIAAEYYFLAKPKITESDLDHASAANFAQLAVTQGVANAGPGFDRTSGVPAAPAAQGVIEPVRLRWSDANNPCCIGIHAFARDGPQTTTWTETLPKGGAYHFHARGRGVVAGNDGMLLRGDELRKTGPIWIFVPDVNAHGQYPNWLRFGYGELPPPEWYYLQQVLIEESS